MWLFYCIVFTLQFNGRSCWISHISTEKITFRYSSWHSGEAMRVGKIYLFSDYHFMWTLICYLSASKCTCTISLEMIIIKEWRNYYCIQHLRSFNLGTCSVDSWCVTGLSTMARLDSRQRMGTFQLGSCPCSLTFKILVSVLKNYFFYFLRFYYYYRISLYLSSLQTFSYITHFFFSNLWLPFFIIAVTCMLHVCVVHTHGTHTYMSTTNTVCIMLLAYVFKSY